MNDQELIDFTRRLLALQSFDRQSSHVPEFICETLVQYGVEPRIMERAGIRNIVARTSEDSQVVFNGHWDTVLPNEEFERDNLPVHTKEGTLYGLGASDMKSGVAAQCAAFIRCLRSEIPGVLLAVVGDEELGGENGTGFLVEEGYLAPYAVLGEPTDLRLSLGQKTGMRARVTSDGKLAHGAYPHRGDNAILRMYEFIQGVLEVYPIPAKDSENSEVFLMTTASVGTIEGGTSVNVVPDRCEATIDIRIAPTTTSDEVAQTLQQLAGKVGAKIEIDSIGRGWQLDKASRIYQVSKDAVQQITGREVDFVYKMGTNDGKYYVYKGADVTNIGPGDNIFSHTTRERVAIDHLTMARDIYVRIARQLAT